jgi:hypothetical protein
MAFGWRVGCCEGLSWWLLVVVGVLDGNEDVRRLEAAGGQRISRRNNANLEMRKKEERGPWESARKPHEAAARI